MGACCLFIFYVGVDALYDKRLFRFGKFTEIHIKILQGFVVRVHVVVFIIGLAEQIIGRSVEDVGDLNDLFECGARTTDLPTADGGLLYAKLFRQFTLGGVVLLPQGF